MKTGEKTLEIMSKAGWYNNWLVRRISPYLSGEILEVGAGRGNFTGRLANFGKVTAIDYDPAYKNANFGDVEDGRYFFSSKKFDAIVCMNVLEHIKDDRRALKNMHSLLTTGGRLILLVPAHQWAFGLMDKDLGHFRRYSKAILEKLLKDIRYSILDIRYLNWLGLIGWFINGKILRKRIIPEGQLGIFDKIAQPFLLLEQLISPPFGLSVLVIAEKI